MAIKVVSRCGAKIKFAKDHGATAKDVLDSVVRMRRSR